MYIEILLDCDGSTTVRKPQGDLDISCPFCRKKCLFSYHSDENLFCRSCGKLLVKRLESSEAYTEEEIENYLKVLKFGGGVLERREAALNLGKYSGTSQNKIQIATLLSKIANLDPDHGVRHSAKKGLKEMAERVNSQIIKPVLYGLRKVLGPVYK